MGADVNAKDNHGWTALMEAAKTGHLDVVKLLLDEGADVNAKDNYGWTALKIAEEDGHKEIVELLKAHGAK
ncbi:MAG: ankyrin repeat domain-containing protein [Desulfomonilaceae bacterium]